MVDANETRALKASFRGALDTTTALSALQDRVTGLDEQSEIPADLIEALASAASAHAVGAAALRGLVNTIQARRGAGAST